MIKLSEIFEPLNQINWRDQAAHAAVGYIITTLVSAAVNPLWALSISALVAVIREQTQHFGECHAGCRTDLAFWIAGSIVGVVAVAALAAL